MIYSCQSDRFKGPAGSPLREYGQLQVIGLDLCDQDGNPVQLRGMSTLDVYEYRTFVNLETFQWLRDDWNMDLFRAAMYTEGNGRLLVDRKKDSLMKAVETALDAGLYVIIDWHILSDGDPLKYLEEAKIFFDEMAQAYQDYPNVIYEICNEPNGEITWQGNVKPFAEEIIPIIRQYDEDGIILVGSTEWSQDVDIASDDPLEFDQIMYTLHFYAGSYGQWLRDKMTHAMDNGAPLFVSEWGTTLNTGHDGVYPALTAEWMDYLDEHNLSWANWSLCNLIEDSAALRGSASMRGQWSPMDITESGLLTRALMRDEEKDVFFADGFENGKFLGGGWSRDGVNVLRGDEVYAGEIAAEFFEGHSLAKAYPTVRFSDIEIKVQVKTEYLREGDRFLLEWFDGSSWHTAHEWTANKDWKSYTVALPVEADNLPKFQFRFRGDYPSGSARALVDNVELWMSLQ
ncbi:MAG: glycoside hydrolase family 5 protein [Spirochaetaceae bacterium]|nr:glycoside hydrolase family 5 protein [Spirochaetaceae bacterium]